MNANANTDAPLPDTDPVRVEIPKSINDTKRDSPELGTRWRESTRRAFQHYLGRGMHVAGFGTIEGDRCAYVMTAKGTP